MTVATGPNTSYPAAILFYDSDTISNPDCFAPFFAIPASSNTLEFTTMSDMATQTAAGVSDGHNDMFIAGTTVGKDYDSLLQGVQITNKVFYSQVPKLYDLIGEENVISASLNWQPIGPLWVSGSKTSNPIGNSLGIDVENKGTYLCWAETVEWDGSEWDDVVLEWAQNTTEKVNAATRAAGIYDAFTYIGDSSGFQLHEIFPGYGSASTEQLLEVSRKYDPQRVFQNLLPGGFKIGA